MPDYAKKIVYLSEAQYQELITNQTITVNGTTVNYNENTIYITPQNVPLYPSDLAEWVKQPNKPIYTAPEVGALSDVQVNGTSVVSNGVANIENRIMAGNGAGSTQTASFEAFNSIWTQQATGAGSHAEGGSTFASQAFAHAEGIRTLAISPAAHSEGDNTQASGYAAHAEGSYTLSGHQNTHAEGVYSKAMGNTAHAEGNTTVAIGINSHSENYGTLAFNENSHSEGRGAISNIIISSTATANIISYSGNPTIEVGSVLVARKGEYSVITAIDTQNQQITLQTALNNTYANEEATVFLSGAFGTASHVEGWGTIADSAYQHVQGKFNIKDPLNTYAHIIGNGTSSQPSNAHTVDWDGNAWYSGKVSAGTIVSPAAVENDNDLTTKEYVDGVVGGAYHKPATGIPASDLASGVVPVEDVQVDGTSVLNNGVANIPQATNSSVGVVRVGSGLLILPSTGQLYQDRADSTDIKSGGTAITTSAWRVLTPLRQHEATFYGLAKAAGDTTQANSNNEVGTYTNNAKAAIRAMIGAENGDDIIKIQDTQPTTSSTKIWLPATAAAPVQIPTVNEMTQAINDALLSTVEEVSGTTPSITGSANHRYICGEVTSISITPPAAGSIDVVFTSGSTLAVLTVPNTVKWPAWFDASTLETNTTYEILITDGVYGSVMTWAT